MNSRIIAILLSIVILAGTPILRQQRAKEQRDNCVSHQKNYGTALEMYSTDFAGRYPQLPRQLVPNYLVELPRCPTNGSDYHVETASNPDLYTIICRGYHP